MYQKIKRFLIDLLFPAFCLGCNNEGTYLCDDCKATLEILEKRYCLCQENPTMTRIGKCQRCASNNLSGLYFALYFKERALTRKLIHFFGNEPYYLRDLAKPLSLLIKDHLSLIEANNKELFSNSAFVFMEQDIKEAKARGYNQSEELAKELSKLFNIPIIKDYGKIKDMKVFLVDDIYKPNEMENYAKALKEKGAQEVWGITVTRQ